MQRVFVGILLPCNQLSNLPRRQNTIVTELIRNTVWLGQWNETRVPKVMEP